MLVFHRVFSIFGVLGRLGAVFGRLEAVLGRLGLFGAVLGSFLAVLRLSWAVLGCFWASSCLFLVLVLCLFCFLLLSPRAPTALHSYALPVHLLTRFMLGALGGPKNA